MTTQARIPSLDGARTLSIALVIASHVLAGVPIPVVWRVDYGNLGVRVFFVISGFLITDLLIREYQRKGRISLTDFYLRRFLRLMPAYWCYIGAVAVLIPTGWVMAKWSDLWAPLLYLANYWKPTGVLGHTWSLSVEEQFYLVWPGLIVLLGLTRVRFAALLLIVLAPVFRVLTDAGHWPTPWKFAFECVADALATGCLLALLRESLWATPAYRKLVSSGHLSLVLPAGALILLAIQPPHWVADVVGLPLLNFGVAIVLDRYMRFPETPVGRLLNCRPMVWLGLLSYSIYLWQQLWVMTGWPAPISLGGTLACAAASYYWLEQPVRNWGLRRLRPASTTASVAAPTLHRSADSRYTSPPLQSPVADD
jgi:peptidoglycan/LPS O-acetylase OafA/YrhL